MSVSLPELGYVVLSLIITEPWKNYEGKHSENNKRLKGQEDVVDIINIKCEIQWTVLLNKK